MVYRDPNDGAFDGNRLICPICDLFFPLSVWCGVFGISGKKWLEAMACEYDVRRDCFEKHFKISHMVDQMENLMKQYS